ncbi:MAG TPA: hypothetical protein DD417_07065 [Elusimicrobia bacterium]|nr:hypothetical protein [Elusimicrobiota bacterium]
MTMRPFFGAAARTSLISPQKNSARCSLMPLTSAGGGGGKSISQPVSAISSWSLKSARSSGAESSRGVGSAFWSPRTPPIRLSWPRMPSSSQRMSEDFPCPPSSLTATAIRSSGSDTWPWTSPSSRRLAARRSFHSARFSASPARAFRLAWTRLDT